MTQAPTQPLLSVEHLTMRFGGLVAIDDVVGEVPAGDLFEEAFALAARHERVQGRLPACPDERPAEQRRTQFQGAHH